VGSHTKTTATVTSLLAKNAAKGYIVTTTRHATVHTDTSRIGSILVQEGATNRLVQPALAAIASEFRPTSTPSHATGVAFLCGLVLVCSVGTTAVVGQEEPEMVEASDIDIARAYGDFMSSRRDVYTSCFATDAISKPL